MKLAGCAIGAGAKAFLIGEVGQAHDGSLGAAHAYIDAVAEAGADAVKFQTHIAAAESTLDEQFRVKFSQQDASRYEYWKRMEFTPDQWAGLARHAGQKGLAFLSSPFSVEAVELLESIGVPGWKVGSGELASVDLLGAIAATRKPVLISSGMSTYKDLDQVITPLKRTDVPVALLQCTSQYPVALEAVGLNVIGELRRRFDCPVGLSDHSGTVYPSLAAAAQGADVIEVHVVFDRRQFGPDTPASITIDELAHVAQACHAFHTMRTHPVDKDATAAAMADMRALFGKSLAPRRAARAGEVLAPEMLVLKKPGTGIPESERGGLIGRQLARDVAPDRLLTPEDIAD